MGGGAGAADGRVKPPSRWPAADLRSAAVHRRIAEARERLGRRRVSDRVAPPARPARPPTQSRLG